MSSSFVLARFVSEIPGANHNPCYPVTPSVGKFVGKLSAVPQGQLSRLFFSAAARRHIV